LETGERTLAKAPQTGPAAAAVSNVQQPPYKCATTDVQGVCLKFYLNPQTKNYDQPPGGERVNCGACQYFFD
jgi:hypothetical protein